MTYALVFFGLVLIEAAILMAAAVLLVRRVDLSGRPVRRVSVEYEDGTVHIYQP